MNTQQKETHCNMILEAGGGIVSISPAMLQLAESVGLGVETLTSILTSIPEGTWPFRLGGNLMKVSSIHMENGHRMFSLCPSDEEKTAALLSSITGEENFLLCAPDGCILASSEEMRSYSPSNNSIYSFFHSSSSGAVKAAMRKCAAGEKVPEFLVSSSDSSRKRETFDVAMRRLPVPGKLIFCRIRMPSVALVPDNSSENNLVKILLEESFCANIVLDDQGVITRLNPEAAKLAMKLWKKDPRGTLFFDYIHPAQREALKKRHLQRKKGIAVPSRYTMKLEEDLEGRVLEAEVSIVSLRGQGKWVAMLQPLHGNNDCYGLEESPGKFMNLIKAGNGSPGDVLLALTQTTRSMAAAYISEGNTVTAGQSEGIIDYLQRKTLAAAPEGFLSERVYHRRLENPFGVSHLLLDLEPGMKLTPGNGTAVEIASEILQSEHMESVLRRERELLSLTRKIAGTFLLEQESIDSLLSDFTKAVSMETGAVFRISRNGSFLRGTAGAGTVGDLPDIPLETLNTASWACLRGETAFFTASPENELRFSSVFPESVSEIAVPFFTGNNPEGVILMASSVLEHIASHTGEFIGLLALLFSCSTRQSSDSVSASSGDGSNPVRDLTLENQIHNLSALNSAFSAGIQLLQNDLQRRKVAVDSLKPLLENAGLLEFQGKWALWFLRTSLYGGKPFQRWIDPVPLLEKTVSELGRITKRLQISLTFIPPSEDMEVCTDGAYVSMIAHSLISCIVDNAPECTGISMTAASRENHWILTLETAGGSVPGECFATDRQPDSRNMAFVLAWKLAEELGGTVSTFSSRGKSTRIAVRLRTSG